MEAADKFTWAFLIDKGSVVGKWNQYMVAYENLSADTLRCRSLIRTVGIDWNKTQPIIDTTESEFQGTFSENTKVPVIKGTLYLNDGSKWAWAMSNVSPRDIVKYMADYISKEGTHEY